MRTRRTLKLSCVGLVVIVTVASAFVGAHITVTPAVSVTSGSAMFPNAMNDGQQSIGVTAINQMPSCAMTDGSTMGAVFTNHTNNMFTFPIFSTEQLKITCPTTGPSSSQMGIRRCQFIIDTAVQGPMAPFTGICLYQGTEGITAMPVPVNFGNVMLNGMAPASFTIRPTASNVGGFYFSIDDQDGNFSVQMPCAGVHCLDPVPGQKNVTRNVTVLCTPKRTGLIQANLYVVADNGDFAQPISLTCNGTNGGMPDINISQDTVTESHDANSGMYTTPITIQNSGDGSLTIGTIGQTGSTAWTFDVSSPCDILPCTLAPNDMVILNAKFTPTSLGSLNGTLSINSNDPDENPKTITLTGTGEGTTLSLVTPVTPPVSIGITPIGQPISKTFTVKNMPATRGLPVTADVSPMSVFTVNPSSPPTIAADSTEDITVTCTPDTATTASSTFSVTGMQTFGNNISFGITCQGTNGNLSVTPGTIHPGEIRIDGAGPRLIDTILMTTNGPTLNITAHDETPDVMPLLVDPPSSNSVVMGTPVNVPVKIDPLVEGMYHSVIHLAAGADTADVDVLFDVVRALLDEPAAINFGTLCIGKPVPAARTISLHSAGSAHIHMQTRPELMMAQSAFTLDWVSPASTAYPIDLDPNGDATVSVQPKPQTAVGTYTDKIAWTTDMPSQTRTQLDVEWIADGGGITPGSQDFGPVDVKHSSETKQVTVQNCGAGELTLSPPVFDPPGEFVAIDALPTTLAASETATLTLVFTPSRNGVRRSTMTIESSAGTLHVDLAGTGLGGDDSEHSPASLYACSCASGDPTNAFVIVIALVLPLVPRRRKR